MPEISFGPPPGMRKPPSDGIPKPKRLRDIPKYLFSVTRNFFSHLFYVVGLVWECAPLIFLLMVLLCLVDGVIPVVGAYISSALLNAIAALIGDASIGASETVAELIEVFRPVLWLFFFEFLFMFLRRLSTRANGIVTSLAGELVSNHIRMKLITKAKTVDQQSFDKPEFYEKLENANREAGMRPIGIITATFTVVSSVISVASFITVLATLSPLAPIVIILASLPGAIINYVYRNRNFRYMRRHSKERRALNYYSEVLTNKDYAKEVKILGLGDTLIDKYKKVFKRYYSGIRSLVLKEGFTQIFVGFLVVLVNCLLFLFVAYTVVFEGRQIGDYSLYTGALTSISTAVTSLVTSTAKIYEGTLFVDNMMTFMKEKATVVSSLPAGKSPVRGASHTLELRHVSFRYPGTERDVIRDVNLTLRSGENTVLVGLNGAGKTTLIKLIMRLYDPTEGSILLDGRDIREYTPEKYYDLFGIIFQDFGKYAETAAENIRFGDIDAEHTDERVMTAASDGNAAAFIEALPNGYDTPLTRLFEENGIELSGGQWQKLSIARAFYKKSDILILDEPTAALDPLAEADVFERFTALSEGKIAIFISHRLSGAVTASNIVVLENGMIVECGSHEELMSLGGKYHLLFTTQAKRYTGVDYDATEQNAPPFVHSHREHAPKSHEDDEELI